MRVNEAAPAASSSSSSPTPIDHDPDSRRSTLTRPEPCSTDPSSRQSPSPFMPLSARDSPVRHVVSPFRPQLDGQLDSPLRQALSSSQTPPPSAVSSTPILTASLNSPPIAHTASATTTSKLTSNDLGGNGSVDLSLHSVKRSHSQSSSPASPMASTSSDSDLKRPQMYTALLMQLRQSTSTADSSTSKSNKSMSVSASRKEKLKAQACFQCPVCKKRFHRHIAMNAHFQNEHVGQVQADKVCRLCSHRAKSVSGIRAHLLKEHKIDLDEPGACLVEPDNNNNTGEGCSQVETTSPVPLEIKKEPGDVSATGTGDDPTDLRTQPQVSFQDRSGAVTITKSTVTISKRKRLSHSSFSGHEANRSSSGFSDIAWKCQDCFIVFPNQTLYFLHRGFHSDNNPWRCNGCGYDCKDMFDFNTHLISVPHS